MLKRKRAGVTLIELLVVLAIIGILLAIFFPAVHGIRKRARQVVCQNNIRQINLAVTMYIDAVKKFPPPSKPNRAGGWTVEILGFLEQGNLGQAISPGTLILDADPVLLRQPEVLRCPSRSASESFVAGEMANAHYVARPNATRKHITIYDAPVSLGLPWLSSPEIQSTAYVGPHDGGYFCGSGSRGVRFVPRPDS